MSSQGGHEWSNDIAARKGQGNFGLRDYNSDYSIFGEMEWEEAYKWQISLNWQHFVILASIPKLWHFHSLDRAVQILYLS